MQALFGTNDWEILFAGLVPVRIKLCYQIIPSFDLFVAADSHFIMRHDIATPAQPVSADGADGNSSRSRIRRSFCQSVVKTRRRSKDASVLLPLRV
jgi:hypothetical protein